MYFNDEHDCAVLFDKYLRSDHSSLIATMRKKVLVVSMKSSHGKIFFLNMKNY